MADGTFTTKESEQQFSLPGLSGLLGPLSHLSVSRDGKTLTLRRGSLLVDVAGSLRIDVGDGTIVRFLAGSCRIFRDERSVTVVALSAPVLVLRGDEIWILPGGYQLSIAGSARAKQSAVPQEWLAEQSEMIASLPVMDVSSTDPLVSLVAFLHSPDVITVESLAEVLALPALSADSALRLLVAVRLAPEAGRMDAKVSEILSSAISETLGPSQLAFAVPALATSTLNVLPTGLIAEWTRTASRMAADDPFGSATLFRGAVSSLPGSYETAGYPKQAMLWRGAISRVNVVLSSLLTGAAADQYAEDIGATHRAVRLLERTPSSSQPIATQQPASHVPSDQLTSLTRQFLLSKDVLFSASVSITIDPDTVDCARVEGIFIVEAGSDVPYTFSYCPADQYIRKIERDGKRLPNDVPVNTFFTH